MGLPHVTILILTWNHWEETLSCLETVMKLRYPNYGVLVVDNDSADGTPDHLRNDFPSVTVIENESNLGFAAGCNVGIRYALTTETDYLLLLNNDTTLPPDFLDHFIDEAEKLPDLGIAAPQMRYADGSERIWFTASRRNRWTWDSADFGPTGPRRHDLSQTTQPVDYLFGTAMLLPVAAVKRVGGFDERFFMYHEDMDLCLRYQEAGYRCYYIPHAQLWHNVSASTKNQSALRSYYKARSAWLFYRKHTKGWRWAAVIPYRFASIGRTTVRLIRQKEWETVRFYWRGVWEGITMKTPHHSFDSVRDEQ